MLKIIIFIGILCSSFFSLHARQLHVLLTADTISNVKKASNKDMRHLKREFASIAKAIDTKLKLKEMYGQKLTANNLKKWITSSEIFPDDIVIFYYTGHGLRTKRNETIWPSFYLPANNEIIDFHNLSELLTSRSAALFIAIADCCNNFVDAKFREPIISNVIMPRSTSYKSARQGLKQLFLHNRGIILASGSIPGKRSWCTKKGGIYTNAFLASLQHEINKGSPNWHQVLTRASAFCNHIQQPQYQINLKSSKVPLTDPKLRD